jgi:NAD(P)-dependent dehydrogenase (short-subunit alcohol dehydrogenase family)
VILPPGLVGDAAVDFTSNLYETRVADVCRILKVNFVGAFLMLESAARGMRAAQASPRPDAYDIVVRLILLDSDVSQTTLRLSS